jgi:transposase InsO family protein
MEIGVYPSLRRHDLLIIDETKIPIPAKGPRDQRIDNLYLISAIDYATRLVVNACVTVGPSVDVIASAFLARILAGGIWQGVPYGGAYQALSLDNAFIFASSERFAWAMRVAGVPPRYARPYTAQDKAVKERWYRTLKDMALSAIPGNVRGPLVRDWVATGELREDGKPKRTRQVRPLNEIRDDARLVPLDELVQSIYAGIFDYNFNHFHSTLGAIVLDAYAADPTPPRPVGLAALWPFALPVGTRRAYKVERRGVFIDGAYWAVKQQARVGEHVSIRQLPGLDPRLLIGTPDGRYIGEVTRADAETELEREARLASNRQKTRRYEQIAKVTQQNALARVSDAPGSAAYVSDTSAKKLAATDSNRPLGDLRAALAVPPRSKDAA